MEAGSEYAPSPGPDQDDDDEDTVPFSESAVDGVDGMVREVEKLIRENMELSATKNALNIVKNDLIKRLDDVTGEKAVLADELQSVKVSRDEARDDVNELARQLNHCMNELASLTARMQLYESQSDGLDGVAPSVIPSALSVQDLESAGSRRLDQSQGATAAAVSSQRLGGSLDCLASVGRSTGRPDGDPRCEAIQQDSVRHGDGALVDAESAVEDPAKAGTKGPFSKHEMARVVAERNYYKERLLDLQEAIRFTEEIRASRQPESPVNSVSARAPPRRTAAAGGGLAARLMASLRQITSGLGELSSELEPSPPVEARCDGIPALSPPGSISVRGRRRGRRRASSVGLRTPPLQPPATRTTTPTTSRVDLPDFSSNDQGDNSPAFLQGMFCHLIGHIVATGAETVFGTSSDFSTRVATQVLTEDVSQLLGVPVRQSRSPSRTRRDVRDTIS